MITFRACDLMFPLDAKITACPAPIGSQNYGSKERRKHEQISYSGSGSQEGLRISQTTPKALRKMTRPTRIAAGCKLQDAWTLITAADPVAKLIAAQRVYALKHSASSGKWKQTKEQAAKRLD